MSMRSFVLAVCVLSPLTRAARQKIAEEIAITPAELGDEGGAYLYHDTNQGAGGAVVLQWAKSKAEVQGENPLAFWKPGKTVPTWKFNSNSGRTNLASNLGMSMKAFYAGCLSFIREGNKFQGELTVFNVPVDMNLKVAFLDANLAVTQPELDDFNADASTWNKIDITSQTHAAAMKVDYSEYDLGKLTEKLFLEKSPATTSTPSAASKLNL